MSVVVLGGLLLAAVPAKARLQVATATTMTAATAVDPTTRPASNAFATAFFDKFVGTWKIQGAQLPIQGTMTVTKVGDTHFKAITELTSEGLTTQQLTSFKIEGTKITVTIPPAGDLPDMDTETQVMNAVSAVQLMSLKQANLYSTMTFASDDKIDIANFDDSTEPATLGEKVSLLRVKTEAAKPDAAEDTGESL